MATKQVLEDTLERCFTILNTNTIHPERFLSLQNEFVSDFLCVTKKLYDFHKALWPEAARGSPLEHLVVDHFDEEQIWQELELQNSPILRHFETVVSQLVDDKAIRVEESLNKDEGSDEQDSYLEEISGEEEEVVGSNGEKTQKISTDVGSDVDFDVDKLEKRTKQQQWAKGKPGRQAASEVDDQFFKLSDMEAFLEEVEKEGKEGQDNDEIDYFQDLSSGDEDELYLEELMSSKRMKTQKKSSRNLKYKDFFDPVEGGLNRRHPVAEEDLESEDDGENKDRMEKEEDEEDMEENKEAMKRVTFDLPGDSDGEDIVDIMGGNKPNAEKQEAKSAFEKRQEMMTEKIQQLEKASLGEKPWQLIGEVTGQARPENSLLEEDVAFDQSVRMAPAITEETTLQLEDIIKQRIKDRVWDDVVRKEKPKEEVFEYKKKLTLDQEKSKLSLAEVYEQEFLKQSQQKTEEEENPAHVEIQMLMDSVFLQLDALSNFHFTPKPPVPEVKVVSNLPSITMEEVAPVSANNATLLAPEEVKEKNRAGNVLGDSEKSATDRKRERRRKKKMKSLKLQMKERKRREAGRVEANKKPAKAEVAEDLRKLAKGGKATVLKDEEKAKALKSSQAFFTQLQDQVKTEIKGAKNQTTKRNKRKEMSASKLKL